MKPIAYKKSIQPGGIIASATPNAYYSTCVTVTIQGWQLKSVTVANDGIASVTLNGYAATVLSSTMDSVTVRTPVVPSASAQAGDIVVTATSGRTTTLPATYKFLDLSSVIFSENFDDKYLNGWVSSGNRPLNSFYPETTSDYSLWLGTDITSSSAYWEMTYALNNPTGNYENGYCDEVLKTFTFTYSSYIGTSCYGAFTIATKSSASGATWNPVWTKSGTAIYTAGAWSTVSLTLPSNTVAIRLSLAGAAYANTNTCTNTGWVFFNDFIVTSDATCDGSRSCSASR